MAQHAVVAIDSSGRVAFQFLARDLNLVMGPAGRGASISFRVLVDGQCANGANGADVNPDGCGIVNYQRTYQLIH